MCKHGMMPTDVLADGWGDSLRRSWDILRPLVLRYRSDRDAPELWDDFEWLAGVAHQRKAHIHRDVHGTQVTVEPFGASTGIPSSTEPTQPDR